MKLERLTSGLRFGWAMACLALALAWTGLAAAPKDFTLEAPVDGKRFKLSEAKGKFVALHFLLKTECPLCLKHTQDYAAKAAANLDVQQIFIKPDSAEEIKEWAAKLDPATARESVTIYRDPEARLAKAFGIADGYQFHGESVHYPALILLDPTGKEVFRHVGKSNSDRFPAAKFDAKLREFKKESAASAK